MQEETSQLLYETDTEDDHLKRVQRGNALQKSMLQRNGVRDRKVAGETKTEWLVCTVHAFSEFRSRGRRGMAAWCWRATNIGSFALSYGASEHAETLEASP